jgi:hypothetical protein
MMENDVDENVKPPPIPGHASESAPILFKAPAKWEQNKLTHSVGNLSLTDGFIEFSPSAISILGKHLSIPIGNIDAVRCGDNYLWRGVVKLHLKHEVEGSICLTFFLGNNRQHFLSLCKDRGLVVI